MRHFFRKNSMISLGTYIAIVVDMLFALHIDGNTNVKNCPKDTDELFNHRTWTLINYLTHFGRWGNLLKKLEALELVYSL